MTQRKNLEQARAAFAFQCASEGIKNDKFAAHVKSIASMLQSNGLGNTCAFLFAKQKKDRSYKHLYQQLSVWLQNQCWITQNYFQPPNTDLIPAVLRLEASAYRAVTIEALALFHWLRRFAEGLSSEAVPAPRSSDETEDVA